MSRRIADGDSTIAEIVDHMCCPICRGDGCVNCDDAGFILHEEVIQGLLAKARQETEAAARDKDQAGGEVDV